MLDDTGWMYYGARYYDPYLNRWTQPDTIVPEAGNPQALNRYSFVANNPVKYVDPSGHCWGVASGLRNTGAYGATCNNIDMALTIVQSPNASAGDKALAGGYLFFEGAAHGALAVGTAGLACVAAGPGCVAAVEGALGIGAAASADGDPTNEVQAAVQAAQQLPEFANPSLLAQHYAKHVTGTILKSGGPDMSEFSSAGEYLSAAQRFLSEPLREGAMEIARKGGDLVRFDPGTGYFGVLSPDGIIRTFFRPDGPLADQIAYFLSQSNR